MKLQSTVLVSSLFVLVSSARAFAGGDDDREGGRHHDSCQLAGGVAALPGYAVSVWAQGTAAYSNPDSIVVDGNDVWVGYQNVTAKDGTDGKTSTVVEYDRRGEVERTFAVPGHNDGLRVDPATHIVWASSNEDGNPALVSIDPTTGVVTPYVFAPTVHGGGFDDMAFVNGKMFITASNPTLNAAGVNVFPAIDQVTFNGNDVVLTPVLMGNATALDTTTHSAVALNVIDPDSMTIDPSGNLVLVDQGGNEIITITAPGTPAQTVTRIPTATQFDDTVWATSPRGKLFLVDATANTIYSIRTRFTVGTVFTETPNDSTIPGVFGTVDVKTGNLIPAIIGFQKPTGLLFVADGN